jgi:glutamate-1-semialdehyde 2,1-aminomutase
MLTVFFSAEAPADYVSAKTSDTQRYARFFRAMLDSGAYLPPSQFEVMMCGLAHQQRDFDQTIAAARIAFAAAR